MHAQIKTIKEPQLRVKIVEQREMFEQNPDEFIEKYKLEQLDLKERLLIARENLSNIYIEKQNLLKISQLCSELNVDGLRGDIVLTRAAKALAAFEKRDRVLINDIVKVAILCLSHRLRKDPLENIDSGVKVQTLLKKLFGS